MSNRYTSESIEDGSAYHDWVTGLLDPDPNSKEHKERLEREAREMKEYWDEHIAYLDAKAKAQREEELKTYYSLKELSPRFMPEYLKKKYGHL